MFGVNRTGLRKLLFNVRVNDIVNSALRLISLQWCYSNYMYMYIMYM